MQIRQKKPKKNGTYCQNFTQTRNRIRHCLAEHNQICHHFFNQNILKYFNDVQNQNFSFCWLKWSQAMEMKQNQTFFRGAYSNLTVSFLSKNIKVFQWLSVSKYVSFMTTVNANNGNEAKLDIFSWDILKPDIIFLWSWNTKIFQGL